MGGDHNELLTFCLDTFCSIWSPLEFFLFFNCHNPKAAQIMTILLGIVGIEIQHLRHSLRKTNVGQPSQKSDLCKIQWLIAKHKTQKILALKTRINICKVIITHYLNSDPRIMNFNGKSWYTVYLRCLASSRLYQLFFLNSIL